MSPYQRGYDAAHRGYSRSSNPYMRGTSEYDQFDNGFLDYRADRRY